MRLTEDARGVYIIAATPFGPDGALDLASLDRLVDFYLERGVDGLTLLGLMGEAQKLTAEEARTVVRRVLARVNGRVPVVVGVSSAGLAPLAALSHAAMDAGAAAVMVAPAPDFAATRDSSPTSRRWSRCSGLPFRSSSRTIRRPRACTSPSRCFIASWRLSPSWSCSSTRTVRASPS